MARGRLTVLFVLAILRHEVCRREGEPWGVARTPPQRGNRGVMIQRLPIGELSREAMGAMERLGRKILRAIKGDSPLMSEPPQRLPQGGLMQRRKALQEDRGAMAWCHPIQAGPALLVAGDLPHAEPGLRVMGSVAGLPPTLGRQKRRRLGEKEPKGASGGVLDGVRGMGAGFAKVGQLRSMLTQHRLERIGAEGWRHRGLLVAKGSPTLNHVCVSEQLSQPLYS